MTCIQTDEHYFQNTEKSQIRPVQGRDTEKSQPTLQQPLLIILKWDNMTEFVYKTHSVFVQEGIIEVQPYEERENETAEDIIHHYIELEKLQETDPKIQDIIACNPHHYSIEKLTSQYI